MITSRIVSTPERGQSKRKWYAFFGINSLLLSIFLHSLFGVGATYLVVAHFQKPRRLNFQSAGPPRQENEVEHKVEMAKRSSVESAPPDLKRITTINVSSIELPEVPPVPPPDNVVPATMNGVDGVMDSGMGGLGSGNGGGGAGGGGGDMTIYGAPGAAGLVGVLYDLKQTPDKKPTEMAENQVESANGSTGMDSNWANSPATQRQLEVLRDFVRTWDMDILARYFKAPVSLSLPQVCIPDVSSAQATEAFHVAGQVAARRWIAVYSAKVMPPDTGSYRFIGLGDDFLMVRINHQNVLDACWSGEELDDNARVDEDVGNAWDNNPLRCGRWFDVEQGTQIDLKILIGEGPGGFSGFVLMMQKKGDGSTKGDYPIFQVKKADLPDNMNIPTLSQKTIVFPAAQADQITDERDF